MGTGQYRFKQMVRLIIAQGMYPSPTRINAGLDRVGRKSIDMRELRWRREVAAEMGFKLRS